jgi:hypothetical protein
LTASAPRCGAWPAGIEFTRLVGSMGPPDTPSVGYRRPLGASVKPLRYLTSDSLACPGIRNLEMADHAADVAVHALERRAKLVLEGVSSLGEATVAFLRNHFPDIDLLSEAIWFAEQILLDVPSARIDFWARVQFFPWAEAERELDQVLQHTLLGYYKSTYDHLRRALELAVVAAFFTSEISKATDGPSWLKSERDTPLFSRSIRALHADPRFALVFANSNWEADIKGLFYRLSDVIHVRGVEASFFHLQPSTISSAGAHYPSFRPDGVATALSSYIEAVRQIATLAAVLNPVLLIDLPITAKFGLNPPMSGFLEGSDVETLRILVVDEVRAILDQNNTFDPDVRSVVEYVEQLPDITEAELQRQSDALNQQYMEMSRHGQHDNRTSGQGESDVR